MLFFNISMIIFAKVCISIRYKDFITQNVQPAKKNKTDKLIFQPICPLLLPLGDLNPGPPD